jgi:hypothetical protein
MLGHILVLLSYCLSLSNVVFALNIAKRNSFSYLTKSLTILGIISILYISENWRDYYRISVWISTVYLPSPPTVGKQIFLSISEHINQNYSIMPSYRVVVIVVFFSASGGPGSRWSGRDERACWTPRTTQRRRRSHRSDDDHIIVHTTITSLGRRSHRPYDDLAGDTHNSIPSHIKYLFHLLFFLIYQSPPHPSSSFCSLNSFFLLSPFFGHFYCKSLNAHKKVPGVNILNLVTHTQLRIFMMYCSILQTFCILDLSSILQYPPPHTPLSESIRSC